MKRPHGLGRHGLQAAGGTQDGSAVGVLVTARAQQQLQDLLIGLIGVLSDLFKHHPPFRVEPVRLEAWLQHQFQQQIQRFAGSIRWCQYVEVNVIKASGGIAAAPQSFDCLLYTSPSPRD